MRINKLRSTTVKKYLKQYSMKILLSDELRKKYFVNPKTDFTRERKLTFYKLLKYMFSRSAGTLTTTLLHFFKYGHCRPSKSAYVKAMKKIKPVFWVDLFRHISDSVIKTTCNNTFSGFHLVGIDGTDLPVPEYDEECHTANMRIHGQVCSHNSIHISAAFDTLSDVCLDMVMQKGDDQNEQAAAIELVDRFDTFLKAIFIGDRGYPSYNLMAHIIAKGQYFLLRSIDSSSDEGIGSYWWKKLAGDKQEGSVDVTIRLTRANTKAVQESDLYHHIDAKFDFLPEKSPFKQGRTLKSLDEITPDNYYEISFRVVRVKINDEKDKDKDTYEILLTNLPKGDFSLQDMKLLYHYRWNIETFFRELKNDEGLSYIHAKITEFIIAEIYSRAILHNIIAMLCDEASVDEMKKTDVKQAGYSINHSDAVTAVMIFIQEKRGKPKELIYELARNLVQIKNGRSFPRKLVLHGFVGFSYRAA
jgi:hypothetical protein